MTRGGAIRRVSSDSQEQPYIQHVQERPSIIGAMEGFTFGNKVQASRAFSPSAAIGKREDFSAFSRRIGRPYSKNVVVCSIKAIY